MLLYENKMGINQAWDSKVDYFSHLHHHIELVCLYDGATDATVDLKQYVLEKDSVLVAFPNQIHSYKQSNQNKSYVLIYSPDDFPEFKEIFNAKVPITPVLHHVSEDIKDLFRMVVESHNSDHPYRHLIERGYMLALLSKLFGMMEFADQNEFCLSAIQNVLFYCDNHYASDISLEKIAEALYISKYYVSHIFSEKIKIRFSDYINALRIRDAAQQLTGTAKSITEIAYSTGYNNIRSFNRQFINQSGTTPSGYRKANQAVMEQMPQS